MVQAKNGVGHCLFARTNLCPRHAFEVHSDDRAIDERGERRGLVGCASSCLDCGERTDVVTAGTINPESVRTPFVRCYPRRYPTSGYH